MMPRILRQRNTREKPLFIDGNGNCLRNTIRSEPLDQSQEEVRVALESRRLEFRGSTQGSLQMKDTTLICPELKGKLLCEWRSRGTDQAQ